MNYFVYCAGNIPYFRSENIKTPHGFSTRLGGVSTEPWVRSLNFGINRGDNDENVSRNIILFCNETGVSDKYFVSASQIHSSRVIAIDDENKTEKFECDGFVTAQKGITLCVKVADCVPILLCDKENGVIGAVHAGWRGAVSGIAHTGVAEMQKLGADIHNIQAAIGPSIRSCCYRVGEDFVGEISQKLGNKASRYIKRQGGEFFADIQSISRDFLLESGIEPQNISESGICTCCNPTLFFSHRASCGKRGTMAAIISL